MVRRQVLTYGFSSEEQQKLLLISYQFKAKLICIRENMIYSKVSDIISNNMDSSNVQLESHMEEAKSIPKDKFILFSGFNGNDLNNIISAIRKNKELACLLAVVTETSREWTIVELLMHLLEEKNALG